MLFPVALLIISIDPTRRAKLPWSPAELYIKDRPKVHSSQVYTVDLRFLKPCPYSDPNKYESDLN